MNGSQGWPVVGAHAPALHRYASVIVEPLHEGGRQTTPGGYRRQAPAPSQTPSRPQLAIPSSGQSSRGSLPTSAGRQVPSLPEMAHERQSARAIAVATDAIEAKPAGAPTAGRAAGAERAQRGRVTRGVDVPGRIRRGARPGTSRRVAGAVAASRAAAGVRDQRRRAAAREPAGPAGAESEERKNERAVRRPGHSPHGSLGKYGGCRAADMAGRGLEDGLEDGWKTA